MTFHRALPTLLSVGLCLTCSAGFCQELQNGDFESPGSQGGTPAGWTITKGTFVCDGQKHKGGKFSGKIDGGDHDSAVYQDLAVTPGASYVLSGVWRNGDKTAAFDVARVTVNWLAELGAGTVGDAGTQTSGEVVSEWTPFQIGPVTVPPGAKAVRIRLASTFNTAAFDDLKWEKAGAAGSASGKKESSSGKTAAVKATDMPLLASSRQNAKPQEIAPPDTSARQVTASATSAASPAGSGSANENSAAREGSLVWMHDAAEGYRAAAGKGKKVLLFFSSDGDTNSDYFTKKVFTDPGIQMLIASDYVPVKLDFSKDSTIAQKLRIKAPGTVVLYNDEGAALAMITDQVSLLAIERTLKNENKSKH